MRDLEITTLVEKLIGLWAAHPIGVWTGSDEEKAVERSYLNLLGETYVRTISDIDAYFREARRRPADIQVIEFGTYLGVISRGLAELGFKVTASDIPKLSNNPQLRKLFSKAGVQSHPQDLACRMEGLEDGRFDCAILCETLEHLPFNPVPVLDEINRILKPGGLLYLAVPNIASARNRALLLTGQTIHNPIADFFEQLAPRSLMTVGLHWREYTKAEAERLLAALDFQVLSSRYYDILGPRCRAGILRLAKQAVLTLFPALSSSVVVTGKKVGRSNPQAPKNIGAGTVDTARSPA